MYPRILSIIFVGLLSSAFMVRTEEISISLFALNLSGCDSLSYCDPFVRIFCSSKISDWVKCGETSKLVENNFPTWPDIFTFQHNASNAENWEFRVIDDDNFFDDVIASVYLNVNTFLNETLPNGSNTLDLDGRGKLHVRRNTISP